MIEIYKDLGKVSITNNDYFDINKSYDRNCIVYDPFTNASYTSKKEVPVGIELNNTEYWQLLVKGNSDNDTVYISAITDKNKEMNNSVGGINKGTKVKDLEGMSFSQLFDMLLFPDVPIVVIKPSYGDPTITVSVSNTLREVGSKAPITSDFNIIFDRAEITLGGKSFNPKKYRAGEETSREITINDSIELPSIMSVGSNKYVAKINYNEGDIPIDSLGNKTADALKAGSIQKFIIVNGTYPVFAYINKEEDKQKLGLKIWSETNMTFEFETIPYVSGTVLFSIPRPLIKNGLLKWNPVISQFKPVISLPIIDESRGQTSWENDNWKIEKKSRTINSVQKDYYFYTIKSTQSSNLYKIIF